MKEAGNNSLAEHIGKLPYQHTGGGNALLTQSHGAAPAPAEVIQRHELVESMSLKLRSKMMPKAFDQLLLGQVARRSIPLLHYMQA